MQDLNIDDVTDAVLAQMADTPDPRLREIAASAVRHLHAFARDVKLTPDEWLAGMAFMTAVGQACTPYRQEFILLSDVIGLSRLVNVMHDATGREAAGTETSLLGPFFRDKAPQVALGDSIATVAGGPEILLFGQVTDAAGQPIPHVEIDVWQTNAEGAYDLQALDPEVMDMRGHLRSDAEGRFHFRSVKPLGYTIPMDGPVGDLIRRQSRHGFRPAHIHFLICAPGFQDLVTALYFGDDAHVDSDTVFGVSKSLVITAADNVPGAPIAGLPSIRFDFHLSRATDADGVRVGSDPSKLMPVASARVGSDPSRLMPTS